MAGDKNITESMRDKSLMLMNHWGISAIAVARESKLSKSCVLNALSHRRAGVVRKMPSYATMEAIMTAVGKIIERRRSVVSRHGVNA